MKGYVVCTTARTGSTLLCEAAIRTGVLGRPFEFFNPSRTRDDHWPAYTPDIQQQIAHITEFGSTPNGVYGLKVLPYQFDLVQYYHWADVLPLLQFVYLERRDLLAQAISYVRAEQTGVWNQHDPVQGKQEFNLEAIQQAIKLILRQKNRWEMYFSVNDIAPLRLYYEDIHEDILPSLCRIGDALRVRIPDTVAQQQLQAIDPQRDHITADWRESFLARSRDLSRLPTL